MFEFSPDYVAPIFTIVHIYFYTSRYCKENEKMSTQYREYSQSIPAALHNRPLPFIKHVKKRIPAAKQLANHTYEVAGNTDNPICTCIDFRRNSYPCKHIIKIWLTDEHDLIIPFTLSDPWWCIDTSVIRSMPPSQSFPSSQPPGFVAPSIPSSLSICNEEPEPTQTSPPAITVDNRIEDLDKMNQLIRERLRMISGFTYENTSYQTAVGVTKILDNVIETYLSSVRTNSNIPLLPPAVKSKKRKLMVIRPQDSALKPKRQRPLKYRKINSKNYVVHDLTSCEAPMLDEFNESLGISPSIPLGIPPIAPPQPSQPPHNDYAISPVIPDRPEKQLEINLNLMSPIYELESEDINMGLNLIQKQWPTVTVQDCLLIQRPQCFDQVVSCNFGDFCQVLHMSNAQHWVAVTNIESRNNEIRLFDSLALEPTLKIAQAVSSE